MAQEQPKKCSRCEQDYTDAPAISRTDDKTPICPDCGQEEALEAFMAWREGRILFPGPKDWPRERQPRRWLAPGDETLLLGEPQLLDGPDGQKHWMQQVSVWENGRWESFMTFCDPPNEASNPGLEH